MKEDFEDVEQQLRQFSAKPITSAFKSRVIQAATQPMVKNRWQRYICWSAAAAVVTLATRLSLPLPTPITNNGTPLKETNVLKPMVTQSTKPNLPTRMMPDNPAYNGKKLLDQYYFRMARYQPVQHESIVAEEKEPETHSMSYLPLKIAPIVLREIKMIPIDFDRYQPLVFPKFPDHTDIQ